MSFHSWYFGPDFQIYVENKWDSIESDISEFMGFLAGLFWKLNIMLFHSKTHQTSFQASGIIQWNVRCHSVFWITLDVPDMQLHISKMDQKELLYQLLIIPAFQS